jgi:VWFA-related protein
MTRALAFAMAVTAVLATPQERPVFRVATDLVPIYASVFTRDGQLLRGLTKADFEILDNGRPTDITVFSSELQPITVAVVVDRSNSNMSQIPWAQRGVEAFVNAMRPDDRMSIRTLESLPTPMTSDRATLLGTIRGGFPPDTSSPVWDTVGHAISSLEREPQRRIVLTLTDGQDAGPARMPATVLQESERHLVSVYAVDYERRTDFRVPSTQLAEPSQWERDRDRARESLERLVRQTGGELFLLREGSTKVEDAFARIAETLRTQYLLGFERAPDGKVHKLAVRVKRQGAVVRVRQSFMSGKRS